MPYVNRLMRRRGRGFGDSAWVQPDCGGTLVPTGNPLSPCVMPGSPLPGGGNASNGGGGNGPGACMQYADFLSAIGGFATCDPRDAACASCNQQKSAALSNLVGGGCVPLGSKVNFSCDSSQAALNQFQNNTPVVNNATVNGSPDSGWVVGSPLPTYSPASSSPASSSSSGSAPASSTVAPVLNLSSAGSPASSALQAAQASVVPSTSDWLTQSMFGGVPNWGLVAGGVAALFLFMSMGGHR